MSCESRKCVRVADCLLRIGVDGRVQCVVRIRTSAVCFVRDAQNAGRSCGTRATATVAGVPPLPSKESIRVAELPYRHSRGWQIALGLTITWGSRADSGCDARGGSADNQGGQCGIHNLGWLVALVRRLQVIDPEAALEPAGSAVNRCGRSVVAFGTQ